MKIHHIFHLSGGIFKEFVNILFDSSVGVHMFERIFKNRINNLNSTWSSHRKGTNMNGIPGFQPVIVSYSEEEIRDFNLKDHYVSLFYLLYQRNSDQFFEKIVKKFGNSDVNNAALALKEVVEETFYLAWGSYSTSVTDKLNLLGKYFSCVYAANTKSEDFSEENFRQIVELFQIALVNSSCNRIQELAYTHFCLLETDADFSFEICADLIAACCDEIPLEGKKVIYCSVKRTVRNFTKFFANIYGKDFLKCLTTQQDVNLFWTGAAKILKKLAGCAVLPKTITFLEDDPGEDSFYRNYLLNRRI